MFDGKMKAVTFSYDDGVTQDKRLIRIFDKYGLKCTFNINSKRLNEAKLLNVENHTVAHVKPRPDEIAEIYKNHELAAHTLTHPALKTRSRSEIIKEVDQDRANIAALCGYDVVGFAYPGGDHCWNEEVLEVVRRDTGVKYGRTTTSTHSFDIPSDLYRLNPTVHHTEWDKMEELAREFVELKPDTPKLFYIWGHAYEFDVSDELWDRFDRFCEFISGRDDIFYGTNTQCLRELFD